MKHSLLCPSLRLHPLVFFQLRLFGHYMPALYAWSWKTQPELDAVPRFSLVLSYLPVLPRFQFSIHLITQALLSSLIVKRVTMAWLYIKPTREVALMNRQVTQSIATQSKRSPRIKDSSVRNLSCSCRSVIYEPTVWSRPGFATQHETLTVFTHLACSQKYLGINLAVELPDEKWFVRGMEIYFCLGVDCHPRTTYYHLPEGSTIASRLGSTTVSC